MTAGSVAPANKALVILPNWLGDLVMATVLLERLAAHPDVEVHVVVRRRWAALLQNDPRLAGLTIYEREGRHRSWPGTLRLGRDLRGRGHRVVFVLPPSFRFGVVASVSMIPERIGFEGEGRRALLSRAVARPERGSLHYVEETDLLYGAWRDAAPDGPAPSPRVMPPAVLPDLGAGPVWALSVGATYGGAKRWPVSNAADFLKLAFGRGVRVLVLGDAEATTYAEELRGACPEVWTDVGPGAADLTGATDLASVAGLLASVDGFVGNDSGLMHLAAALGTPTVGLFGSTNPAWTAPRGPRTAVLAAEGFACSPCHLRRCPEPRFCLETLAAAAAAETLEALIAGEGTP